MTFELRPRGEKAMQISKDRVPGRSCKCKGPGMGMTLTCIKLNKEASASGIVLETELREVSWSQIL